MKAWTMVRAHFDRAPEDWDAITAIFEDYGVNGTVQTDKPLAMSGYLYEPDGSVVEGLMTDLRDGGACDVETDLVPEQDWAESWKQFFVPRRIGQRFLVRPSWEEAETLTDELEIVLEPGQAFGTGDHPTTRMCLEIMEAEPMDGKTVADIGAGSGILSVGACLLGASDVTGVEIERDAVQSARENAERNQVHFTVHEGKGFDPLGPNAMFDIVLSNIISAALINLAPEASRRVKVGGAWIVSGIIEANWADVRAAAERCGFRFETERREDGWVAALFRR